MTNEIKKRKGYYLFTILFAAISFLNLPLIYSKDKKNLRFDTFKVDSDEFLENIFCMTKDSKGFIWFGTEHGLYRFDGFNLINYKHKSTDTNTISHNYVTCLLEDKNYLWIGTFSGGLNRFDKLTESFKVYKNNPDDKHSLISNVVEYIYITNKEEMWVATAKGLNQFDRVAEKFKHFENNPSDLYASPGSEHIFCLYEDRDNYLWIGGIEGGLDRFDPKKNTFKNFKHDPADKYSLSDNWVMDIREDRQGSLWISTWSGGVNKFDKDKEIFYRYEHDSLNNNSLIGNNIVSIYNDPDGDIWFGGKDGISIFDPVKNNFTNFKKGYDYPVSYVSKIFGDDNGNVWICSLKDGFSINNKNKWTLDIHKNKENDNANNLPNEILTFCEDLDDNVWVGTRNGIYIFSKDLKPKNHFVNNPKDPFSLSDNVVTYIFKDSNNNMWISTLKTLEKYEPESGRFIHFYDYGIPDYSNSIFKDKAENLWLGLHNSGVIVFDNKANVKHKFMTPDNGYSGLNSINVFKLYLDSKDEVWAATNRGLANLRLDEGKVDFIKHDINDPNSLSVNSLIGITEDKKGYLWIITNGGGLNRFDRNLKTFKHYTEENGLASNSLYSIVQDNNDFLWFSTSRGISMFDPYLESVTNFGQEQKLHDLSFNLESSYQADDGRLYFGSQNGFITFYPDSIPKNRNIPKVVLTDFRIFNKKAKLDTSITEIKEIKISYYQNFISFDYAVLDYSNPSKNQYAYMMEGIDEDWNYVGNMKSVNYTDLDPGEYIFRVKGSNNDGLWCIQGAGVQLTITPPWFDTIWFKSLAAFLIMGGLVFIFLQRTKKLKKEKERQGELTKKLIESQENERKRVAGELHDSLGQNLMVIKNKLLFAKIYEKESSIITELDEITNLTSNVIEEVRNISHNLRPYELERLGLTEAILSIFENINKAKIINVSSQIENIDNVFSVDLEIHYYRIIQECMGNILKHSKALSTQIKIIRTDDNIETIIKDDGVGFDSEKLDTFRKGMGIAGIQERVNILSGQVNIESAIDNGTLIKIIIPINK